MSMKSLQGRRTPFSRDECRTAPDGRRPLDQAHGLEPKAGCQSSFFNDSPIKTPNVIHSHSDVN